MTKELCQGDLDVLIEMFTSQHIQSLDLKNFYAGPDKKGLDKNLTKSDLLYASHNQKEAYVNAAILFCPCFLG